MTTQEQPEHVVLGVSKLQIDLGLDLHQVIPNLSKNICKNSNKIPPNQDDFVDAQQRLQYLFCGFIEVILSCLESPIKLFLDGQICIHFKDLTAFENCAFTAG